MGAAAGGECKGLVIKDGSPGPCSPSVRPGDIGREGSNIEFVPSEERNRWWWRWRDHLLRRHYRLSGKSGDRLRRNAIRLSY